MAKIESIAPVKTPGKFVYSDIDFAALGEIVRRVSGLSLDAYARRYIFAPLGMRDTMFTPPPALLDRIAPADIENGVLRWGAVQDPMAFHMGEVAGHAGLFGTADDLAKFAEMLLAGGSAQGHRILIAGLRRRHDPAAKPHRPEPPFAAMAGTSIRPMRRCSHRPSRRAPSAIPATPAPRFGSIRRAGAS